MGGCVACQALEPQSNLNELLNLGVRRPHGLEFRDLLSGYLQSPTIGNQLGHAIRFRIGDAQHSADVANDGTGRHAIIGCDLGDPSPPLLAPVFLPYVIDDLITALDAEIDVEVGHADAVRIEESFEDQVVFEGVNSGDVEAIGHQTTGGRASARAHGNAVLFGVLNEIPHNEEVGTVIHPLNYGELIFQSLSDGIIYLRIAFGGSFIGQSPKIRIGGVNTFGNLKRRDHRMVE